MQLNTYLLLFLIVLIEFLVIYGLGVLLYNKQSVIETAFTQNPFVFVAVSSILVMVTNWLLRKVAKHSAHS